MVYIVSSYILILPLIAWIIQRKQEKTFSEYYAARKSMGFFVLAMTISATYVSASSFIGGPGLAYTLGLGWVYLAAVQYPVILLSFGMLGAKLAQIGRKINAYDIRDILAKRYSSKLYSIFINISVGVYFFVILVIALTGGARILESLLAWDYNYALLLFALALGAYTSIGGFRVVVITDVIQGLLMLITAGLILFRVIYLGGGLQNIVQKIELNAPSKLEIHAGGQIASTSLLAIIFLVGFGMIVHPMNISRILAAKSDVSFKKTILLGTIVTGFLMFALHFSGFLANAIFPDLESGDRIIGELIVKLFNPLVAGLLLAGVIAAIMSSADSALILLSLSIHRLVFQQTQRGRTKSDKSALIKSLTFLAIIIATILAFNPPRLIVFLNIYALGIVQATLFWPLILGLLWRRGNTAGAVSSSIVGLSIHILLNIVYKDLGALKLLPITIACSAIAYIIGSYLAPAPKLEKLSEFFET